MGLLPIAIEAKTPELIATFLESQSPATREAYRGDLKGFQDFLATELGRESIQELIAMPVGELNFVILRYRDSLKQKFSPSTVNRRLGAVRSLFKLARLLGLTTAKIEIPNIKSESYRDTRGPGLPAFKRMIEAASAQSEVKARRDRAILRLMFDLALRASELLGLDLVHVELGQKRVSIKGKGRTQRQYLSLPPTSISAVGDWISIRGVEPGPLFTNLVRAKDKRKRLSRAGLYDLIRELGARVDIKTRPHGIRHLSITSACVAAQNNGFGIEEVLDHSRHKSVATLMIYRDRERDTQGAISTLVSNTILEEDDE